MARLTTRRKNFGMANAVKKTSTEKSNRSKSPKQTKSNASNGRQSNTTTLKRNNNQQSDSMPRTRSTQSILKRELAQKFNNPTIQRSTSKSGGADGRKGTPKAAKTVSKSDSAEKIACGQTNAKTDEQRQPKDEPSSSVQSNSSGSKSPSILDRTSISMYRALAYQQKPDSTVLSSELVDAMNEVIINSSSDEIDQSDQKLCPPSPDLFETESMEGYACSDNMERQPSEKVVEMVSTGVQCKFSEENRADAQVGTDDDFRVKMVDVGIQTSPMPAFQCPTCQTDASYGFSGVNLDDSAFANLHDAYDEPDDEFDDYESESSYDHCLDDFDNLEHLNDDNAYHENVRYDAAMDRIDDQPDADQNERIYASPPRHQIYQYQNDRFRSPESPGLKAAKKKYH